MRGLLGSLDDGENFVPTPGGLLDGLPDADIGSSLHMFMEPEDIATIPGLPQHVYDEAARNDGARQMGSSGINNPPTARASTADPVAPQDTSASDAAHDRAWDSLSRYAQSAAAHDAAVNASGNSADIRLQDPWIDIPQRHWSVKDSSVILSPAMEGKIDPIAQQFYDRTARDLVVNDGYRTPADQAQRMYDKFKKGGQADYVGSSGREIRSIYNTGVAAGTDKAAILNQMSSKIGEQLTSGHPVSRHLEDQGVDFRDKDLTAAQTAILREIIQNNAGLALPEGIPQHMHASFPRPKR